MGWDQIMEKARGAWQTETAAIEVHMEELDKEIEEIDSTLPVHLRN